MPREKENGRLTFRERERREKERQSCIAERSDWLAAKLTVDFNASCAGIPERAQPTGNWSMSGTAGYYVRPLWLKDFRAVKIARDITREQCTARSCNI